MNTFFRAAATLSMISLFGAGCLPASAPVPTPTPTPTTPTVETPAAEPGHPPAVVMTVGDETYPGVEGSYCYEGLCVDKIGPPQLVTEEGLEAKDVARNSDAYFAVGGTIFEFGVTMLDASGAALDLRIPVSFRDGRYTVKIPNVSGEHFLMAQVRFGQTGGDDVTYVFPINVR